MSLTKILDFNQPDRQFSLTWFLVITAVYLPLVTLLIIISDGWGNTNGVSPWYLPMGFSFALLLATRDWRYIFLVFCANLIRYGIQGELDAVLLVVCSMLNATAYWAGVRLIQRKFGQGVKADSITGLHWFVVAAGLSTLAGTLPIAIFSRLPDSSGGVQVLLHWFFLSSGELVGILAVVPFLITGLIPTMTAWLLGARNGKLWESGMDGLLKRRAAGYIGLVIGTLVSLYLGFGSGLYGQNRLLFLTFLPVIAAGVWYGLPGATRMVLFTNICIMVSIHFYSHPMDNTSLLHFFSIVLTLSGLYTGAVVTDRNTAMQQVAASEARFKALVDSADDRIFLYDRHQRITNIYGRWLKQYSFPREQYIGKSIQAVFQSGDAQVHIQSFERAVAGEVVQYEWKLESPYAPAMWFQTSMSPLIDGRGEICGVVSVGRDITSSKSVQQALQRSQQQLETFFSSSLDGFFIMMLDEPVNWDDSVDKAAVLDYVFEHERVTRANQAMIHMYNSTPDAYLGSTPHKFFAHDPEAGKAVWSILFDTGKLHTVTNVITEDGTTVWIEGDYVCMYDEQGRVTGHFGVQRDISRQKQAEETLRKQNRFLQLLNEITQDALEQHDLASMQQILADRVGELFGADGCFITNWDETLQRTLPAAAYGDLRERYRQDLGQPDEITMTQSVLEAGRPLVAEDVHHSPYISPAIAALYPTISMLGLPLIADGRKMGAALVGFNRTHQFTEAEIRLGEQVGVQLSLAVYKAQLNDDLKRLSVTDALTGVNNRRGFTEIGLKEIERSRRYNRPLSMILFDIDFFKSVNDRFGHAAGDDAVVDVARRCLKNLREADVIGRHGGDEFIILLPETDLATAAAVAERLRLAIAGEPVLVREQPIHLTISAGVSSLVEHVTGVEDLITMADDSMYQAKDAGRNCIVAAGVLYTTDQAGAIQD